MSSTRALFSDKARYFSQSECSFYGNFIIISDKKINSKNSLKVNISDL